MAQEPTQPVGRTATICSFACLGAQAVLVALYYLFMAHLVAQSDSVAQSGPNWLGRWLAGLVFLFAAALVAALGVCALAAVGMAFGVAARRSGWGVLALILNALVFLGTGIPLLMLLGSRQ